MTKKWQNWKKNPQTCLSWYLGAASWTGLGLPVVLGFQQLIESWSCCVLNGLYSVLSATGRRLSQKGEVFGAIPGLCEFTDQTWSSKVSPAFCCTSKQAMRCVFLKLFLISSSYWRLRLTDEMLCCAIGYKVWTIYFKKLLRLALLQRVSVESHLLCLWLLLGVEHRLVFQ